MSSDRARAGGTASLSLHRPPACAASSPAPTCWRHLACVERPFPAPMANSESALANQPAPPRDPRDPAHPSHISKLIAWQPAPPCALSIWCIQQHSQSTAGSRPSLVHASRERLRAAGDQSLPEMGNGWPRCDLKLLGDAPRSALASNLNVHWPDEIGSLHPVTP